MNNTSKQAITLVELLVALALMGLLFVGITQLETYARFHLVTSARHVKVQNETTIALEQMSREISMAIGHGGDWPVRMYNDGRGIRIRIDSNQNGILDPAIDTWIAYRHEGIPNNITPVDSEIRFYDNVPNNNDESVLTPLIFRSISRRIRIADFGTPGLQFNSPFIGQELQDNTLIVRVISCWEPSSDATCGTLDNPQAEVEIQILMPSVSAN